MTGAPRVLTGLLGALGAASAARLLFGPGLVNYDSMYALVWGGQLADGQALDLGGVFPPTPHPLSTMTGLVLSPFGPDADGVLRAGIWALAAVTAYLGYELGRAWFGVPAGVAAAALVLTRDVLLFNTSLAYFDVGFAALVLGALLVETRRRRAGWPVLTLLGLAGLWRPEAWLLAGAYWLWMLPGTAGVVRRVALLAGAAAAPAIWLAFDLATTGDPLFSLTYTQDAAGALNRVSGPAAVPIELPRTVAQATRPAVAIGGAAGLVLAFAFLRPRPALLPATLAVAAGGTAVAVAAGTPLHTRYVLVPALLVTLLCAGALFGWTRLPAGHRGRRVWQVAAAAVALAIAVTAPRELGRIDDARDSITFQSRAASELESLAAPAARAAGCGRLTLPGNRPVPAFALALERRPGTLGVARGRPPRSGAYLRPANLRVADRYLLTKRKPPAPPAGFREVDRSRSWRLYTRCTGSRAVRSQPAGPRPVAIDR